jgi:hypothetical protein
MQNEIPINLLNSHVFSFVSRQVEREFEAQTEVAEDISFAIMLASSDPAEEVTVYEWYTVSEDFTYRAKIAGEVIVDTPFGIIWGRQTTGLALSYDPIVQEIISKITSCSPMIAGSYAKSLTH